MFNQYTFTFVMFTGAMAVLWTWYFCEKHFNHQLEQIKLINTVHIEQSMREDGWFIDQMDTFDRSLNDDVYDYDKDC